MEMNCGQGPDNFGVSGFPFEDACRSTDSSPSGSFFSPTLESNWVVRTFVAGTTGLMLTTGVAVDQVLERPMVGTSPAVHDSRLMPTRELIRPVVASADAALMATSIADQVKEALSALSMNKSQLASILNISRPTLYSWLAGGESKPDKGERLLNLLRTLRELEIGIRTPLKAQYTRRPILSNQPSVFEALCEATWDKESLGALLNQAKALSDAADERRRARKDRLGELGYEEPSEEERHDTLARNMS